MLTTLTLRKVRACRALPAFGIWKWQPCLGLDDFQQQILRALE